jgi:hypothetical protein
MVAAGAEDDAVIEMAMREGNSSPRIVWITLVRHVGAVFAAPAT